MTMVVACGTSSPLGTRVAYGVYEGVPFHTGSPATVTGGLAGSCMQQNGIDYSEASRYKWALGTGLDVDAYWPDRTDCTGFLQSVCPSVHPEVTAITPAVWTPQLRSSDAVAVISLQSIGVGTGGFKLDVAGAQFAPDFILRVEKPAAIQFELTTTAWYDGVVPGAITEVDIPVGQDTAVAVTLRDAAGDHLCGPVSATVITGGTVFTIDRFTTGAS